MIMLVYKIICWLVCCIVSNYVSIYSLSLLLYTCMMRRDFLKALLDLGFFILLMNLAVKMRVPGGISSFLVYLNTPCSSKLLISFCCEPLN